MPEDRHNLPPPPGVEEIVVCALSGLEPTAHCPHRRAVFVPRQDEARPSCSWHRAVRIDRRNGLLPGNADGTSETRSDS